MASGVLHGARAEAEPALLPDEAAALGILLALHRQLLETLATSGIPCMLLRLPVASEPVRDLDLLVAPEALSELARALAEMGFLPKMSPLGLPSKVVFTCFDGQRFHSLDVHTSVVSSRGLEYLDARLLLQRRVLRQGLPLPSPEDSLLHLVLHALLGRQEIGGKYLTRIRQLASLPLERDYLQLHLDRYGLRRVFDATLAAIMARRGQESRPAAGFDVDPSDLARQARRRLMSRVPANLVSGLRYRLAGALRLRRRAALVALVGVDGVGKSSLVQALTTRLSTLGLKTTNVYLGCWGRYQTGAVRVHSFSPRDAPAEGESKAGTLLRGLKNLVKFWLFYGAIVFEQSVRYLRGVVRTPSHLVLSDRYFYDLELPFSRRYVRSGRRFRKFLYRVFPQPDLIFHLQARPEDIRARKAELTLDQVVEFDAVYAQTLAGRTVCPVVVEGTPEEIADRLIAAHWKTFLRASWRHASDRRLRRACGTTVGQPPGDDLLSHDPATFR